MRFTDERLSSTHPTNRRVRTDDYDRGSDEEGSDTSPCPGPLIVVSNRQPYRHEYADSQADSPADSQADSPNDEWAAGSNRETRTDGAAPAADGDADGPTDRPITVDEPTGGLTAGLDPVVQETEGTWIAWGDGDADFDIADEDDCVAVPPDEESYTLQRIDLSEEAVDSYYYGFSNRVLWPLCHGFVDLVENRSNDFEWYRTVNERFAEAVADHATADSVVWLQDYHFAFAPRLIRESVPSSTTVAQFWHIPWPTPETFQHCPGGVEILEGLLGNDLLGFHVDRYVDRFLECVRRYLPSARVDRDGRTVTYDGTTTRVVATPMGVNAASYDETARAVSGVELGSLFDRYDIDETNAIGLGVDRLDYSKGIPERLAGIERFLEYNPGWHEAFTFVQAATPSRTDIDAYGRHNDYVRSEVQRINQRFGTAGWDPIVYTEDYLSNEELCGLYRRADVMCVSPLVDGMNLVAQEYVAANVDGDGVLLLSEGTGAHETLGSHALTIVPTDTDDVAAQFERGLSMPARERRERMGTLRGRVFDRDLEWWMETQFDWIRRVHDDTRRAGLERGSDSRPSHDSDGRLAADSTRTPTDRSGSDRGPDPTRESGEPESAAKPADETDGRRGSDSDADRDRDSDSHERTPPM